MRVRENEIGFLRRVVLVLEYDGEKEGSCIAFSFTSSSAFHVASDGSVCGE